MEADVLVQLDHDVITSVYHWRAGMPLRVTEEDAEFLCMQHGAKRLSDPKPPPPTKAPKRERAVVPEPAKAETPEDKTE